MAPASEGPHLRRARTGARPRHRAADACTAEARGPHAARVAVLVAAAVEAVRERSDRPVPSENLVGLCEFHHLRCIHGGWLRVTGRAPDALTWTLRGRIWTGPHT